MLKILLFVACTIVLVLLPKSNGYKLSSYSFHSSISIKNPKNHLLVPKMSFTPGDDYFNRPGAWDDPNLDTLFVANRRWSQRMRITNPQFFEEMKHGHAPKILWIGCSDARVPANELIGESAGSVFIHRNIANLVSGTDFNCMSVIQYAVDVLQVKHIIVCGHYDCGGIRAAMEPIDHKSPLENWLRIIRDTYRLHRVELDAIADVGLRRKRLVELNVMEQCLNIFKTAVVQRKRVETFRQKGLDPNLKFTQPRVHAFVYEPGTGELKRLEVDFKPFLEEGQQIYGIYHIDKPVVAASTENATTPSSSSNNTVSAISSPKTTIISTSDQTPVKPHVVDSLEANEI